MRVKNKMPKKTINKHFPLPELPAPALDFRQFRFEERTYSLSQWLAWLQKGTISLERKYAAPSKKKWNAAQISQFIESIWLQLPLLPFYIDASLSQQWFIIDGKQRLGALARFVGHEATKNEKYIRLEGLRFFPQLNGKTFAELPAVWQQKLLGSNIPITGYWLSSAYDAEVRINIITKIQGTSTPRIIIERHIEALQFTLARFIFIWFEWLQGSKAAHKNQFTLATQQLVLQAIAFLLQPPDKYNTPIAFYLRNLYLLNEATRSEQKRWLQQFRDALYCARQIFGERAFCLPTLEPAANDSTEKNSIEIPLLEMWVWILTELFPKNNEIQADTLLRLQYYAEVLGKNPRFRQAITQNPYYPEQVHYRFRIARLIVKKINRSI